LMQIHLFAAGSALNLKLTVNRIGVVPSYFEEER
jgi:hypothetical protein